MSEHLVDALGEQGIKASFEKVAGHDVFVIPQDLPSLGSVNFLIGDASVTIIGHGDFTVEELKDLAESTIKMASAISAEPPA